MNDKFQSLDEAVAAIRAETDAALKAMGDKLLAAEVRATLCEEQLNRAILAKEDAIQVTSRLIECFGTAEEAFARARKYALAVQPVAKTEADHPLLPKVEPYKPLVEGSGP